MHRALSAVVAAAALCAAVPAAQAQSDLGDVLGTTGLQDTLTHIGAPQINPPATPDPNTAPTTDQQTTEQPAKPAHAASYYCHGQSKKHVRGRKGTPFSQCTAAMRTLQNGDTTTPAQACRSLSRKHIKGMKKTPYAACVRAGTQLILDQPS